MKILSLSCVIFLVGLFASDSQAQGRRGGGPPRVEGWQFNAGFAFFSAPLFEGDDENALNLAPDLRARYGNLFYASIPEGIGFRVRPFKFLELSPLVKYQFPRQSQGAPGPFQIVGETDDLEGLGDIEGTPEFGGYLRLNLRPIRLQFEYRKATSAYQGEIGEAQVSFNSNLGPVIYSLSLNTQWASKEYFNTYFGVNAEQALASGLAEYSVEDAGINRSGAGLFLLLPIFQPMTIAALVNYSVLDDRSGQSSLVEERGRREQLTSFFSVSWAL